MAVFLDDILPASLAARLTPEQRQAVQEANRATRLTVPRRRPGAGRTGCAGHPGPRRAGSISPSSGNRPQARGLLARAPGARLSDHPDQEDRATETDAAEVTAATVLHLASAWPPDAAMDDWIRTFTPRPLPGTWRCRSGCTSLIIGELRRRLPIPLEGSDDDSYVAPEAQQAAEEVVDEDAAVVRFVSDVVTQAIDDQATDIHFEPQEGQLRIRYRGGRPPCRCRCRRICSASRMRSFRA